MHRRETVLLRELLESDAWRSADGAVADRARQVDRRASPIVVDLARMPHLLVAGTTGSGKSVGVNALILSLLYRHAPDECRFLMIDPKMLELSMYNGIPHLLSPVVTDPHKAAAALNWVVRRDGGALQAHVAARACATSRCSTIACATPRSAAKLWSRTVQTGFDEETGEAIFERDRLDLEPMPYIVVVVDEFADLMIVAGKEVEAAVQRLAQMARAAGIHLIMATQRPSVDVITGTIKANFPTRISFKVASKIDSRTILNEQGAEQLLGHGDMLYSGGSGAGHARARPLRLGRGGRAGRRPPARPGRARVRGRHHGWSQSRRRRARRLRRRGQTTSISALSPSSCATRRPRPATSSAAWLSATTAPPT